MTGMPTDKARKMMKLLRRLIKQEQLYSSDQLIEMKSQLKILEKELLRLEEKTSKGFGKKCL